VHFFLSRQRLDVPMERKYQDWWFSRLPAISMFCFFFSKADTSLLACDKVSIVGSKEILFMAAWCVLFVFDGTFTVDTWIAGWEQAETLFGCMMCPSPSKFWFRADCEINAYLVIIWYVCCLILNTACIYNGVIREAICKTSEEPWNSIISSLKACKIQVSYRSKQSRNLVP
jgi:hypothetical protein